MKTHFLVFYCLVPLLFAACQPAPADPTPLMVEQPIAVSANAGPEELVAGFYTAWMEYARLTGNPLVDELYKTGGYFTPTGIAALEVQKTRDGWTADPVLCAQDIPENIEIESSAVTGHTAVVGVVTSWGTRMGLDLVRVDDAWQIEAITCLGR